MTDQTIPTDATDDERRLAREWAESVESNTDFWGDRVRAAARVILHDIPAPPLPTLADMTPEERRACTRMQADTETWGRVVLLLPNEGGGRAVTLDRWGHVAYEDRTNVTPRPDLPRLEWPGDKKPAPAPALPAGWRLADHRDHGRVIVTSTEPDGEGDIFFVYQPSDGSGADTRWCKPDELTYIGQEADTPTAPDHLAVGTVIESADDPRIDALPVGSVLLDLDEEATIKGRGEWTGAGYIPIPSEGTELGPWTVLHIPKEEA